MDNKKEDKGYIVEGYLFATREEAERARKELEGIKYLQRNNNMKDIRVLEQVYEKLLKQGLFCTPVGLNYLKYLQNAIRANGDNQIAPIPVRSTGMEAQTSMRFRRNLKELDDVGGVYKKKFRVAMAVIGVLLVCMVIMFGIAATTNQPNILNYEEKVIDKYEQWEQELERREQQLKKGADRNLQKFTYLT